MKISGVIHTYNEEKNIANAIGSLLPWVDEVVVIDMHSEDATRAIAARMGARVVLHERLDFADPARDFGIDQCKGDWIMALDADEMVPGPLAEQLLKVARRGNADVVMISFETYIAGRAFTSAGWGRTQEAHPRFFRKGVVFYPPIVHAQHQISTEAKILVLPPVVELSILHFNYISVHQVLQKLNRYTGLEAQGRQSTLRSTSHSKAIYQACRSFVSRYLYRRGYREGWQGLFMCAVMVMYELAAFAKQKEMEQEARYGSTESSYRRMAEQLLAGYVDFRKGDNPG